MSGLPPSLKLLRVLSGEGNFHIYRLLRDRRVFLFAKCLLTTFACFRGQGRETEARSIAFVKGLNQLRYYEHAHRQLEAEVGALQLYASAPLPTASDALLLPRISMSAFTWQVTCLFVMLLTGKRRHLNLYLLSYARAIREAVNTGWRNVESFVCFNDQPYDVACIINALHERKGCRTIVIQHGLILNHNFYFPAVAKEFWAWGELSKKHYTAWSTSCKIAVKGRYYDDRKNKASQLIIPPFDSNLRVLVAPSFHHAEVRDILLKTRQAQWERNFKTVDLAIKFHPATKMRWILRRWIKKNTPFVKEELSPMEILSKKYDVLVTKNSTSSVDFLLLGKPVIFSSPSYDLFPSYDYGFSFSDTKNFGLEGKFSCLEKNESRLKFLKFALNV